MDLRPSDDERAIDEVFQTFFANECSIERVRAAEPLGFDPLAWTRLAETGAPGMAVDAAVGGGGASLGAVAVTAAQLGRHLAPVPLLEHVAATRLLVALDPTHPALPELIEGARIGTLAFNGQRLVPNGAIAHVVIGRLDDLVVVAAGEPPGTAPANTANLPIADRALDGTTYTAQPWARARAEWQALMATTLAALGRRAVEIGVDYVRERHQFGVPVGSFQSVQHGLASAITAVDGAEQLASRAVFALDSDVESADTLAGMAFLFAAEAAQRAAAASLQYHGGYGYAEEYDIQLYYRRAKGWALQYGEPGVEYQRLADHLLASAS